MTEILLIFPHQLTRNDLVHTFAGDIYIVEEHLFFKQYNFHKQKLVFHRATMKAFEAELNAKKKKTQYIGANSSLSDIRQLIKHLSDQAIEVVHYIDPTDNWLEKRITSSCAKLDIKAHVHESSLFINRKEELSKFFHDKKKKFFQTTFYIDQRKQRQILLDGEGKALGGKWSFDAENRKKFPKGQAAPAIQFPKSNTYVKEALAYCQKEFTQNIGSLGNTFIYPVTPKEAEKWLEQFFQIRFHGFGTYEDAIVKEEEFLHHSLLSPLINVGLLDPMNVIQKAIAYAEDYDVPLNSLEGFVRQIMGWREFIRGVYECKGTEERTKNYWKFNRKIPASFYDGTTGIVPIDKTIHKVLDTGYCHHIERLMILGNFMVLCEFDPDDVYRWFMELFIDAYDWVMVPNVYGMSQFADGGLMSTKPYISSSNYVLKMSNYKKGDWCQVWDQLFWRFLKVHEEFFYKNPRMRMLIAQFNKRSKDEQKNIIDGGESFLKRLDKLEE